MFTTRHGKPADKKIRRALNGWSFNLRQRDKVPMQADIAQPLTWVRTHTPPVSVLSEASEMRGMLTLMSAKLDGLPATPSVVRRNRALLFKVM